MPQHLVANCKLTSASSDFDELDSTELAEVSRVVEPKNAKCNSSTAISRRPGSALSAICIATLWLITAGLAMGQDMVMPGIESNGMDHGAAPMSDFGSASFYSQELGTILRLRYNTESYGQNDHGNFDLGTMQVLTFDDSILFVDGQVTMNDVQGVGFNVGTGFRWLSFPPYSLDTGRVEGVSIWADGTHTDAGNFFPQIGLSYESLGELWDFRTNSYIPVGEQDQVGNFFETGVTGFQGNSIAALTEAVVDSSFYASEVEVARRLGSERDAWAFAGPYFLANDNDDTVGYRAGLRGYAYPDLLLQMTVSNDEIFDTNATFSVVWFVGRTRTDYRPACGVPDRFREPVLRNDYVVLAQSTAQGGIPLTQPDGTVLRIVHVDSTAAPGGDGTFENPFDMLSDVNGAGSQEDDIILAHAQSVFNGDTSAILKDNQRLLGEGAGLVHTVLTFEDGSIPIPETAPGARDAARPMILAALGDAIVLDLGNEVAGFDIDGQSVTMRAIVGTDLVSGTTNLHDLDIRNTTTSGLSILGNSDGTVTVANTVSFTDIAGIAVQIDGDVGGATDQINGTITVNSAITNNTAAGRSVSVQDLGAGANVDFTGAIVDNGTGIRVNSNTTGATIDFTGPITLSTGVNDAFEAIEAGTLAVSNTGNSISTTTGRILNITDTTIAATGVNFADINRNTAGAATSAVELRNNLGASVTLGVPGDDAGEGGTIAGGTADAIVIDNSNATVSGVRVNNTSAVSGILVNKTTAETQTVNLNDLETNGGDIGVEVTGNGTGTLNMTVNDSSINDPTAFGLSFDNIDTGTIVVDNTTIDGDPAIANAVGVRILNSNANFTFDSAPATDNTLIQNFDGADFVVDGGSAGTITFAGRIVNASATNATDDDGRSVEIRNRSGGSVNFTTTSEITDDNLGVIVQNNSGTAVVNFQGVAGNYDFDTAGATALTVTGNTGGTYTFNNFDITTTTGTGVSINGNAAAATINFTGLDIVSTGTGQAFDATGPGTLSVSGAGNTLMTNTGVALDIRNMTIGGAGVQFESVNVTNGSTNGIFLENLTGTGLVLIGNPAGVADSGGTLTTANEAIVLRNVANVDLNNMRVAAAGNNAVLIEHQAAATTAMDVTINALNLDSTTGTGINVVHDDTTAFNLRLNDSLLDNNVAISSTGSGAFGLLLDSTTITTTGTDIAFSLAFSGSATDGDVTIRNGSIFTAADANAFNTTVNGTNADIEFSMDDSMFNNASATAETAEFFVDGGATLDANVVNNTFTNTLAAEEFFMTSDGSTTRINLNLDNNTTTGVYHLQTLNQGVPMVDFNFGVVERDTADARNGGTVTFDPNINEFEDISNVEAPTVP
ncbi:MAG: hypothetical protein WD738_21235 [Pirellulales bacterium]